MWISQLTHLYLTTHNTRNRQTSIPPAGFEPAIPASDRPQTDELDGVATGDRLWMCWWWEKCSHHSPQPEIPTDISGLSMSEPVAWELLRNVRFYGLNVLLLICFTMPRHSQSWAFRSNRRSSVPIKMAAKGRFTCSMLCHFRAHAVPLACRVANGLVCVFPIWFTQCGPVGFTIAMQCQCRDNAMLWPCRSSQGHGTVRPSIVGL